MPLKAMMHAHRFGTTALSEHAAGGPSAGPGAVRQQYARHPTCREQLLAPLCWPGDGVGAGVAFGALHSGALSTAHTTLSGQLQG